MNKPLRSLSQAVLASTLFVSGLSYAELIIDSVETRAATVESSDHAGKITITPTGALTVNPGDAINLNKDASILNIAPNNLTGQAAITGSDNAVRIENPNSEVTIGSGTQLKANNAAGILVQGTGSVANINNAGKIEGATQGLYIKGADTTFTNATTGTVLSTGGPSLQIQETGATITNQGVIGGATNDKTAVQLERAFNSFLNAQGAQILAGDLNRAIDVTGTDIAGTLTNAGSIEGTSGETIKFNPGGDSSNFRLVNQGTITTTTGKALLIEQTMQEINNQGGTISATGGGGNAIKIQTNDVALNLLNSGVIAGSNGANAIAIQKVLTGNISNSGTISTDTGQPFIVGAKIDGSITNTGSIKFTDANSILAGIEIYAEITQKLVNRGDITVTDGPGIEANASAKVTQGIENFGHISSNDSALELSQATNSIKFTQQAGTIKGDLELSQGGGNVLVINGGTITGDILTQNTHADTLTVNGGVHNGTLFLHGDDTINLSSGQLGKIIGQNGTNESFNILGSTRSNGEITNIVNMNLKNHGTIYTLDHDLNFTDQLNLAAGTTLNANANIDSNGTLNNEGSLNIASNAKVTPTILTPNSATLGFSLQDSKQYAKMELDSVTGNDLNNSTVNLHLDGTGYVAHDQVFDLITSANNFTKARITLVTPNSASLAFAQHGVDQSKLQIKASRTPYQVLATAPTVLEAAQALDKMGQEPSITANADFAKLFGQLDSLSSAADVAQAIDSLTPQVDGGVLQLTQDITQMVSQQQAQRLQQARDIPQWMASYYAAGDASLDYGFSGWAKTFAQHARQEQRQGISGYQSDISGLILGLDRSFNSGITLGGTLNYVEGKVDSNANVVNQQALESYQLALYGGSNWSEGLYIEGYLSGALNQYQSERQINVGTLQSRAKADYKAWQVAGQLQSGYRLKYKKYRITPNSSLKYSYLGLDNYTESGALGLTVINQAAHAVVGSLGINFSSINPYQQATYVPELQLNVLYDFVGAKPRTTNHFINSPILFKTPGAKPAQTLYQMGLGLTAYNQENLSLAMRYELTYKKQYWAHQLNMKLSYQW